MKIEDIQYFKTYYFDYASAVKIGTVVGIGDSESKEVIVFKLSLDVYPWRKGDVVCSRASSVICEVPEEIEAAFAEPKEPDKPKKRFWLF